MKCLLSIPLTFVLLALLPASAPAQVLPDNPQPVKSQVSGWNRVRDLARGDAIYIQTAGGVHQACRFGGATEDSLFCDPLFDGASEGSYRLDRTEVERIRLEQSRWNLKEFVGAGAAVGFAVPLVAHRASDPMPRVIEAPICAGIGAIAGLFIFRVASPVAQFIPGKLVYRQLRKEREPRASAGPVPSPSELAP